jgi:hypothetical protein
MRNAARSGWELSRPEELIFELFKRPKGQARRFPRPWSVEEMKTMLARGARARKNSLI